ncbi:MAG: PEP-CTERM sorting domain-containing protein [Armatimonadota bacterium]
MKMRSFLLALIAVFVLGTATFAHDGIITWSFDGVGIDYAYSENHLDDFPFKGTVTVNATNNSDIAWGDFHFKIFVAGTPPLWSNLANVTFDASLSSTSVTGATIVVNNTDPTGATLDFYFYGNPVLPGQSATFIAYTDNTIDKGFFGVMVHPTPVPEPGTIAALGTGLVGLAGFALRRRK